MTLNKRYSRSIKSNLSFYVSTTILTVMTLVLVFIMYMGGKAIWEFGDKFFVRQNLEDAEFETYLPISAEAGQKEGGVIKNSDTGSEISKTEAW